MQEKNDLETKRVEFGQATNVSPFVFEYAYLTREHLLFNKCFPQAVSIQYRTVSTYASTEELIIQVNYEGKGLEFLNILKWKP